MPLDITDLFTVKDIKEIVRLHFYIGPDGGAGSLEGKTATLSVYSNVKMKTCLKLDNTQIDTTQQCLLSRIVLTNIK